MMRPLLSLSCLLSLLACTSQSTAPALPQPTAVYGQVSEGSVVSPSAVLADLDAFDGKRVRVEGTATAVCAKAGCWMDVADEQASIRVKVRDGEVVFPPGLKGRRVVAEGTLVKIPQDPARDPAACGTGPEHVDCARPRGAMARLDGLGASVY